MREFFRPELEAEAAWTDYAVYHLDGVMCMRNHLDFLLEMDAIKAIEWTPGVGSPPTTTPEYIPVYKRILQKGKRLVLLAEPEEVEVLLNELPPQGLFIKTWATDEEEARAMLKMAVKKAVHR